MASNLRKELNFILTITNPTHVNVTITLLPHCDNDGNGQTPKLCGKIVLPRDSFDIPGIRFLRKTANLGLAVFTPIQKSREYAVRLPKLRLHTTHPSYFWCDKIC